MELPNPPPSSGLSLDAKVAIAGVVSAAFTTAGVAFQKLNGTHSGNVFISVWLLIANLCFLPTFLIGNKVFLMGGNMSLFQPVTALNYVFTMVLASIYFGEAIPSGRWFGCGLIVMGVIACLRS